MWRIAARLPITGDMADGRTKPPFYLGDVVEIGDTLPIQVLDVGAMIEGEPRYAALVDQGLAEVTGFEPDDEKRAELAARSDGPHSWLPYFLGDGGKATFHITLYRGCSSLFEPDAQVIDKFATINATTEGGNFTVVGTRPVTTSRLDDVAECPRPDYAKLDVQGSELVVLTHGVETLSEAMVLEVEVEFVPIYKNQPLFGDIHTFLHARGWMMHKLVDVAGRSVRPFVHPNQFASVSQVLWADAVFVRGFTDLSAYSADQLLKAAVVLHDVYCSYDLVNLFLTAHDQARETALAEDYMQAIASADNLPRMYMSLKEAP